ncbi:helix-turn-helix domain-containing protein [Chloroflexota bacterium]
MDNRYLRPEEELLDIKQLAKETKYSERQVRDMLKRGEIIGGQLRDRGKWVVTRDALNDFKEKRGLLARIGNKEPKTIIESTKSVEQNVNAANIQNTQLLFHEQKIFRESDDILNENRLDSLVNRLIVGIRFYEDEWQMLAKYLAFFDKVSQRYINANLRELNNRLNQAMERMLHFMEIHSEIVSHGDPRGLKYKLYPGGNSERFYDHLTNDKTRPRAERRLGEKVDRLARECQHAYKEYRSSVRETLFL